MKAQIGVQLYTLRDDCEKDFLGTLSKVAALGYKGVEFAGFYGVEADVLKAHLDQLGLVAVSSHTSLVALENSLEEVIAYNQVIGNNNIVCPWSQWDSPESFVAIVSALNMVATALTEVGMNLYYHNHAHEFEQINGQYALDILFDKTEAKGVQMELDTYWVQHAGIDPVAYMEKYNSRCGLIHLKDMKTVENRQVPAAIGEGTMPIKEILKKAEALEIPWILVENDYPVPNGIDNITLSMLYLRSVEL